MTFIKRSQVNSQTYELVLGIFGKNRDQLTI